MPTAAAVWLLLLVAVIAANLPWLSERLMLVYQSPKRSKPAWMRFLEWLLLYFLVGLLAFGLEKKTTGEIHHQGWVFYTVTLALFLVFALPGFIYRYDLKKHLDRRKRLNRGSE